MVSQTSFNLIGSVEANVQNTSASGENPLDSEADGEVNEEGHRANTQANTIQANGNTLSLTHLDVPSTITERNNFVSPKNKAAECNIDLNNANPLSVQHRHNSHHKPQQSTIITSPQFGAAKPNASPSKKANNSQYGT